MSTTSNEVRFKAASSEGTEYTLIATQTVILAFGGAERSFPWEYSIEDGRSVKLMDDGSFVIEADNVRLTSDDPNKPPA